jgi:hypothetical protein
MQIGCYQVLSWPVQFFLDRAQKAPARADGEPQFLEVILGQLPKGLQVDVLLNQWRSKLP